MICAQRIAFALFGTVWVGIIVACSGGGKNSAPLSSAPKQDADSEQRSRRLASKPTTEVEGMSAGSSKADDDAARLEFLAKAKIRRDDLRKSKTERDATQAKEEAAYRSAKSENVATRKLIFFQSLLMSSEEQARKNNPSEAKRIDRYAQLECDEIIKGFPGTVAARNAQELRDGKQMSIPVVPADPDEAKAIPTYRMPDGERCVDLAAVEEWGLSLEQIPAIVVDKWLLKNVPYMSYRAGDYEMNIYGDPDSPACIQLSFGKSLRYMAGAKQQGLAFLASLLENPGDRCLIKSLNTSKDLQARGGLTFEVIPETEPGAHGCWCAQIYSREVLEKSRASPQELRALTVAKEDTAPAKGDSLPSSGSQSFSPSRRGGSVIVKGYTKKDGSYVAPHSRAAPGRGSKR